MIDKEKLLEGWTVNLDKTYCTKKECEKQCEYKLTPEIEAAARLRGKILSLHKERCKDTL